MNENDILKSDLYMKVGYNTIALVHWHGPVSKPSDSVCVSMRDSEFWKIVCSTFKLKTFIRWCWCEFICICVCVGQCERTKSVSGLSCYVNVLPTMIDYLTIIYALPFFSSYFVIYCSAQTRICMLSAGCICVRHSYASFASGSSCVCVCVCIQSIRIVCM